MEERWTSSFVDGMDRQPCKLVKDTSKCNFETKVTLDTVGLPRRIQAVLFDHFSCGSYTYKHFIYLTYTCYTDLAEC